VRLDEKAHFLTSFLLLLRKLPIIPITISREVLISLDKPLY
jgi:hypothetical protein